MASKVTSTTPYSRGGDARTSTEHGDSDNTATDRDACPQCDGRITRSGETPTEYVCADCGFIVETATFRTVESSSSVPDHNRRTTTAQQYDRNLGSDFSAKQADPDTEAKYYRLAKRFNQLSGSEQRQTTILDTIAHAGAALSLHDHVLEFASRLAKQAYDADFLVGGPTTAEQLGAATVYLASRIVTSARRLPANAVSTAAGVERDRLQHVARQLNEEFNLAVAPPDPEAELTTHMTALVGELSSSSGSASEPHQPAMRAERFPYSYRQLVRALVQSVVNRQQHSGMTAAGVTGPALYVAATAYQPTAHDDASAGAALVSDITQQSIAAALDITAKTIRYNINRLLTDPTGSTADSSVRYTLPDDPSAHPPEFHLQKMTDAPESSDAPDWAAQLAVYTLTSFYRQPETVAFTIITELDTRITLRSLTTQLRHTITDESRVFRKSWQTIPAATLARAAQAEEISTQADTALSDVLSSEFSCDTQAVTTAIETLSNPQSNRDTPPIHDDQ